MKKDKKQKDIPSVPGDEAASLNQTNAPQQIFNERAGEYIRESGSIENLPSSEQVKEAEEKEKKLKRK